MSLQWGAEKKVEHVPSNHVFFPLEFQGAHEIHHKTDREKTRGVMRMMSGTRLKDGGALRFADDLPGERRVWRGPFCGAPSVRSPGGGRGMPSWKLRSKKLTCSGLFHCISHYLLDYYEQKQWQTRFDPLQRDQRAWNIPDDLLYLFKKCINCPKI